MGKVKEQKSELMNAFSRMNYLFQAAIIASKTVPDSVLANYYGRLMREVSKKVVEKIHPEIKRSLCCCCSYPIFTSDQSASVKVRPHKKKKRKKNRSKGKGTFERRESTRVGYVEKDCNNSVKTLKKDLKPNKLLWSCNKCGFTRRFLQRPSHGLWIDACHEESENEQQGEMKTCNEDSV